MSAEELLREARAAWRHKLEAEQQLSRMRGYRRQTPGMKHDAARYVHQLGEAEATLRRVLGGAS